MKPARKISKQLSHNRKEWAEGVCLSTIQGHPAIFTTSSAERDKIKGPITYFCCSATASLSASGSVATTTLAFSFSASLSDNSWWEKREGKKIKSQEQINSQSSYLHIACSERKMSYGLAAVLTQLKARYSLFSSPICFSTQYHSQTKESSQKSDDAEKKKKIYQHRFSFFRIWAFDSREVWIGIFLFRYWNGGLKAKCFESQLHVVMSNSMKRGMNKLQICLQVQLPVKEKRISIRFQLFNKTTFMWESKRKCNYTLYYSADFCIIFKEGMSKKCSFGLLLETAGLKLLLLENEIFTFC